MPNVHKLPVKPFTIPEDERVVEAFDYSDFCALLEAGSSIATTRINGITLMQFPRAVLIENDGHCTCISTPGTSMDGYVREALAELDRKTVAA